MKTSQNLTVFSCFQGLEKGCIVNKWFNVSIHNPCARFHFIWSSTYLRKKSSQTTKSLFYYFLISQRVLDISMKVFSPMAMVWTLLLVTLFWIMTSYRNLGLTSFHQRKTFQIQFSILVTVMMGTREEYHTYS